MSLWRSISRHLQRDTHIDWNKYDSFFHFTRGRFVSNEAQRMAQRHIKFDMNQLCQVAGNAVGKKCVDVEKFADGMYNKAFLLTMHDDKQIVAKIPNPNAGLPHFTTASEVATMDMMRNILNTPAPHVIAWESSNKNAVQAEYIIMEKAKGVQLGSIWPTMEFEKKVQVMKAIARHQQAWAKMSFSRIGSLYYAKDLSPDQDRNAPFFDESGKLVNDSKFAIGPIVGRDWMDFGRAEIECNRGPWVSTEDCRRAALMRDIQAARSCDVLPTPSWALCGPSLYEPTRDKKIRACEAALQAFPRILPREQWASTFHIWHDDLHEENIFVDPEDPSIITGIIDWQSTYIAPLFDHTVTPGLLDYDGPSIKGEERPKPPSLQGMQPDEEAAADRLFNEQLLVSGYKFLMKHNSRPAFDAILHMESNDSGILSASRNLFGVGKAPFLGWIAQLENSPVKFGKEELTKIEDDVERFGASLNAMNVIKDALGDLFPEKWCVRPDQYNDSKAALARVKEQIIEDFSKSAEDRRTWEEVWPFDD